MFLYKEEKIRRNITIASYFFKVRLKMANFDSATHPLIATTPHHIKNISCWEEGAKL